MTANMVGTFKLAFSFPVWLSTNLVHSNSKKIAKNAVILRVLQFLLLKIPFLLNSTWPQNFKFVIFQKFLFHLDIKLKTFSIIFDDPEGHGGGHAHF